MHLGDSGGKQGEDTTVIPAYMQRSAQKMQMGIEKVPACLAPMEVGREVMKALLSTCPQPCTSLSEPPPHSPRHDGHRSLA